MRRRVPLAPDIPHALAAAAARLPARLTSSQRHDRQGGSHAPQEIVARYSSVRRFFPALLRTIEFTSNEAGKPVLKALTFLRDLEGQK